MIEGEAHDKLLPLRKRQKECEKHICVCAQILPTMNNEVVMDFVVIRQYNFTNILMNKKNLIRTNICRSKLGYCFMKHFWGRSKKARSKFIYQDGIDEFYLKKCNRVAKSCFSSLICSYHYH